MTTDLWVDAAPFRAHLQHLMATGPLTVAEVAVLAGISRPAAEHLLRGRSGRRLRRVSPETARLLLAVTPTRVRALRWSGMPADAALEQLSHLRAAGWSDQDLIDRTGLSRVELGDLTTGAAQCTRLTTLRLQVAVEAAGLGDLGQQPTRGRAA
jgi:hypothetical protein